jgi:ABC-type transporter Mla subunit MlaD
LIGILNDQRDQLTQLASDSEQILGPLSRERAHVAGFFANSGAAAQASAERGADLEASLRKFPAFLREFRTTMHSLQGFSDAATPTFAALGKAAPSFTEATRLLTPFSAASTVSLKSLGVNGEKSGPTFQRTDPLVVKVRDLARSGAKPTTQLAEFFASTRETRGFDGLVDLIYDATAANNAFDKYGHYTRLLTTLTNCLEYELESSSCSAKFTGVNAGTSSLSGAALRSFFEEEAARASGTAARPDEPAATVAPAAPTAPETPELGEGHRLGASTPLPAPRQRALLDYLLGP